MGKVPRLDPGLHLLWSGNGRICRRQCGIPDCYVHFTIVTAGVLSNKRVPTHVVHRRVRRGEGRWNLGDHWRRLGCLRAVVRRSLLLSAVVVASGAVAVTSGAVAVASGKVTVAGLHACSNIVIIPIVPMSLMRIILTSLL